MENKYPFNLHDQQAFDDLGTQVARASKAMVLTWLSIYKPALAPGAFKGDILKLAVV